MRAGVLGLMLVVGLGMAGAQDAAQCSLGSPRAIGSVFAGRNSPAYSMVVKSSSDRTLADGNVVHEYLRTRAARNAAGTTHREVPNRCYVGDDGQPTLDYTVFVEGPYTQKNWMTWQMQPYLPLKTQQYMLYHRPDLGSSRAGRERR